MKEIVIPPSASFEEMVDLMKKAGDGCYCIFYNTRIESNDISLDKAAAQISGFKYKEWKEIVSWINNVSGREAEIVDDLVDRANNLIVTGKEDSFRDKLIDDIKEDPFLVVLDKKALDIMTALNENLDNAIDLFNSESISSKEFTRDVVRRVILDYSPNGVEFYKRTATKELTEFEQNKINRIIESNNALLQRSKAA